EVFVADDLELPRRVALKELQARHSHALPARHRFLREAEITSRLEHPGVVPVHGLGRYADGRLFYAMRFIEGETLAQAVRCFHDADARDGPTTTLRELLQRFVSVCQTIAYAHSRGIVHRDLKPANVMLGAFGETLVVDWGLARELDGAEAEP